MVFIVKINMVESRHGPSLLTTHICPHVSKQTYDTEVKNCLRAVLVVLFRCVYLRECGQELILVL